MLVLDVADTGPGISKDERGAIFEAFYSGRAPTAGHLKGTGIGLSVVNEFVQAHGGSIEIVDGVFPGAHFRVRLPLAPSLEVRAGLSELHEEQHDRQHRVAIARAIAALPRCSACGRVLLRRSRAADTACELARRSRRAAPPQRQCRPTDAAHSIWTR